MESIASTSVKPAARKHEGGVKDTIESILVAFILAFIFRAFVVEAFVIPTGSMAPTLMGAHMRFQCPDCSYRWAADYRTNKDLDAPSRAFAFNERGQILTDQSGKPIPRVLSIVCPNCGYRLPRDNKADPENDATAPRVDFGDRILVLKYLYLFSDPKRWDVVVSKAPTTPPNTINTQNYIKRLVGKPGESLMVLDGDIYVGKKDQPVTDYEIQSKPRSAQQAMWRIVYDNDFQPKNAGEPRDVLDAYGGKKKEDPRWKQPWVEQPGGGGWSTGSNQPGERIFTFNNPNGASTLLFNPPANSLNVPLSTWMGYNVTSQQFGGRQSPDTYLFEQSATFDPVSDLKLELFYQRHNGDGPLRLTLSKNDVTFIAEIYGDRVRLLRANGQGKEMELAQSSWTTPVAPAHIEFTNVDYRVALRIDDTDLLVTTKEQYHPDMAERLKAYESNTKSSRPTIGISAANQISTLQHISLWRDVYYTNRGERGYGEPTWGTPANPVHLGDDEFFTMGDNSSNSSDARYWTTPINLPNEDLMVEAGRVPARFMLGKAFFVYWPAGYRALDKGLIPNFGEMRFIH